MVTISVLGPIELDVDGHPVHLHGRIQQTLLASLLVGEGRSVCTPTLIDELWDENPPANADNALQAHVSRLRRKIAAAGGDRYGVGVERTTSGYRLTASCEQVDAHSFREAVAHARRVCDDDPEDGVAWLHKGLELWRGPVFGGDLGGPSCRAAAVGLEERHMAARELLFDLELRLGRHRGVIPTLTGLVSDPGCLNERFCEQLMIALYRGGRQSEALASYRLMRNRLDDELGIPPSPSLRGLERAVLEQDPRLAVEVQLAEAS